MPDAEQRSTTRALLNPKDMECRSRCREMGIGFAGTPESIILNPSE